MESPKLLLTPPSRLDIAIAADSDTDAIRIYRTNFPKATTSRQQIERMFPGNLGNLATKKEAELLKKVGSVHAIVGGPPCQGHSDLNNHTRRTDPKNDLYDRMVRATEVFRPSVLMVENVPTVRRSRTDVVGGSVAQLTELGYSVSEKVFLLSNLGVPQARRRHILLATSIPQVQASSVLEAVSNVQHQKRSLRWAIGDPENYKRHGHGCGT